MILFKLLNAKNTFQIVQTVDKLYYVDPQISQVQLEDTRIYHYYTFTDNFYGSKISLRSGISLPTSTVSQDQGLGLGLSVRPSISKDFLHGTLHLAYSPVFRYNFNTYTTSPDGYPLAQMSVSNSLFVGYDLPYKFNVSLMAAGGVDFRQQSLYQTIPNDTSGSYSFSAYLSYQLTKNISPRVGVDQSAGYIQDGRYEVDVYDPQNTRFIVALDLSL